MRRFLRCFLVAFVASLLFISAKSSNVAEYSWSGDGLVGFEDSETASAASTLLLAAKSCKSSTPGTTLLVEL